MKHTRIAVLFMLAFAALPLLAQQHPNTDREGRINTLFGSQEQVNITDSAEVYKTLVDNAPIEPEFTAVPRFAIIGRNGKFYFSTGATLKFTASYDWGNPVPDPSNLPVADLTVAAPGNAGLFQMTAQQSSIFFNIIGFPNSANQVGLFISIGMASEVGNRYRLTAGPVYLRYRDLLCGYTSSLYNDKAADSYTIDSHGPCASGSHDAIQFNWQHYVTHGLRLAIGIEQSMVSYTPYFNSELEEMDDFKMTYQRYPDIPAYINYDFGKSSHVRLSGVFRPMSYYDKVLGKRRTNIGWGVKFTGAFTAGPMVFYTMAQTGSGIASFLKDNTDHYLDMVPDKDEAGKLVNTRSWGFIAAAQYNIRKNLFASATYSYLRNYIPQFEHPQREFYDNIMRWGHSLSANVIWNTSSLFRCGLEYEYVTKCTVKHKMISDNRIVAMLMMNF